MVTKKQRGFTLMELLIVIGLIGIITAIGFVSYSSAQKKSRDTRRVADMKAVQNAFEQYYSDHDASYPAAVDDLIPTYLPAGMPVDPKADYAYTPTFPETGGYCLCAHLEGTTTGGNASDDVCTMESGAYYCVKALQ